MDNMFFTSSQRASGAVMEPHFTRTRHRFRGPRESEKFNLDADSFYADVTLLKLYIGFAASNIDVQGHVFLGTEALESSLEGMASFVDYLANVPTHWEPTSEDSDLYADIEDLSKIRDRLNAIEARIKNLENG